MILTKKGQNPSDTAPLIVLLLFCSFKQVLVYESGAVEIHKISSVFFSASGDELDRFASYLDSVL